MQRPYDDLWAMLAASMPERRRFADAVAALDREGLIQRHTDVIQARNEIREKWNGPYIDEKIEHLSEDSTEDLEDWIVGQGHEYWTRARGADDCTLAAMFAEYAAERQGARGRWDGRTPAIGPSFYESNRARFPDDDDGDEFLDAVHAELELRAVKEDEAHDEEDEEDEEDEDERDP